MLDKRKFYINGAWVDPVAGTDFDVINPSTEEAFAIISLGGKADIEAAISAAKKAFETWAWSSKEERLALMEKILAVYTKRSDEMGEVISQEMGAPIDMSKTSQSGSGSYHIAAFIEALKHYEFERELRPNTPNDRILVRTDWRLRSDHALELADEPDRLKSSPGHCDRLHHDPQTLGAITAFRHAVCGNPA